MRISKILVFMVGVCAPAIVCAKALSYNIEVLNSSNKPIHIAIKKEEVDLNKVHGNELVTLRPGARAFFRTNGQDIHKEEDTKYLLVNEKSSYPSDEIALYVATYMKVEGKGNPQAIVQKGYKLKGSKFYIEWNGETFVPQNGKGFFKRNKKTKSGLSLKNNIGPRGISIPPFFGSKERAARIKELQK